MAIESYRDLRVWQEAMELAEACYRISKAVPASEGYGLTSQVRRSSASVPANIAEGYGRGATGSYTHFLKVARGSLKELETHLLLAGRVEVADAKLLEPLLERSAALGKMLNRLIQSVEIN